MILAPLSQAARYATLHPLFPQAFDYLRNTDPFSLAPGRHDIDGDRLFVIAEDTCGRERASAKLECHRRYIDIQLVLAGSEEMGWKALSDCRDPVADHSAEKDIRFFRDAPAAWVAVPPGHFCIFFPEDAHAPLVGTGAIRKLIFKIAADAA